MNVVNLSHFELEPTQLSSLKEEGYTFIELPDDLKQVIKDYTSYFNPPSKYLLEENAWEVVNRLTTYCRENNLNVTHAILGGANWACMDLENELIKRGYSVLYSFTRRVEGKFHHRGWIKK